MLQFLPMPEISISAETLFHVGNFAVTNSILTSFIIFCILIFFAFVLRRRISLLPGMFQSVIEVLFEQIITFMENVLGSRAKAERYFPFIATVFLFVLFSNWFGLLPIVGSIQFYEHGHAIPLLRSPAADLNFTIMLAIISVIGVNILAVFALGIKRHAHKFFVNPVRQPILSFVGVLELVSEFVKIISFSFRLFGNVFAGEVLLAIVAYLVPAILPLPFLFLEVFVGFVQAFIFSVLTLVFMAMAVSEETSH